MTLIKKILKTLFQKKTIPPHLNTKRKEIKMVTDKKKKNIWSGDELFNSLVLSPTGQITCYIYGDRLINRIGRVLGRPPTTEEIDSLVEACIKRECFRSAIEIAEELRASRKAIDSIVKACLKKGDVDNAKKACLLPGRPLDFTTEESSLLVEAYIKKDRISEAINFVYKNRVSHEVIDSLVKACIKRACDKKEWVWVEKALKVAKLGASREGVDFLVEFCTKKEWLIEALEAAKLGASPEVIYPLITLCTKRRWIEEAEELAELAGIDLANNKIENLINSNKE